MIISIIVIGWKSLISLSSIQRVKSNTSQNMTYLINIRFFIQPNYKNTKQPSQARRKSSLSKIYYTPLFVLICLFGEKLAIIQKNHPPQDEREGVSGLCFLLIYLLGSKRRSFIQHLSSNLTFVSRDVSLICYLHRLRDFGVISVGGYLNQVRFIFVLILFHMTIQYPTNSQKRKSNS